MFPAEREQLVGEGTGAFDRRFNGLRFLPLLPANLLAQDLGMPEDDSQQVIEVVRYSPSQASHCLHLLGLPQLVLHLLPLAHVTIDANCPFTFTQRDRGDQEGDIDHSIDLAFSDGLKRSRLSARHLLIECDAFPLLFRRNDKSVQMLTAGLFWRVSEQPCEFPVDALHDHILIDDGDSFRRTLNELLQKCLLHGKLRLGRFQLQFSLAEGA